MRLDGAKPVLGQFSQSAASSILPSPQPDRARIRDPSPPGGRAHTEPIAARHSPEDIRGKSFFLWWTEVEFTFSKGRIYLDEKVYSTSLEVDNTSIV